MIPSKIPKSRATRASALALLAAFTMLALVPSCASSRVAQYADTVVRIKGVCRIEFGQANFNWWLLQGSLSNLDISPEPGVQLAGATYRVFEDANGNGAYDAGEHQKSYTSSASPNGLSINNVGLSAGDIAGWNTNNISWQVEVTSSNNQVYIHSQHL
jgi:opacity protein-like surface antigen